MGLAFVDIPAVEGLYRIADTGDTHMSKTPEEIAAEVEAQAAAAKAKAEADEAEAQAKADADAAAAQKALDDAADAALAEADAAAKAAGRQLVSAHSGGQVQAHTFRVAGADVNDFAKVQEHIQNLETFRTDTINATRTGFIDGLVATNVLPAPQADQFRKLIPDFSNDQFEAFKAGFEGMPTANIFGKHDVAQHSTADARTDRISVLEGIVQSHRYRGATEAQIQETSSFKELQTIKNASA